MESSKNKTDRYVTYDGIDCDGNANRLIEMLRSHIDNPEKTNEFWERFKVALDLGKDHSGRKVDNLFLIHSYINTIRDFFEEQGDNDALSLLEQIEVECC